MRIRLKNQHGSVTILCHNAQRIENVLTITENDDNVRIDLDASGFDFDINENNEIVLELHRDIHVMFLPARKSTNINLSELATGEKFMFRESINIYRYTGGRWFKNLENGDVSHAVTDLPVKVLENDLYVNWNNFTTLQKDAIRKIINGGDQGFVFNPVLQEVFCLCGHPAPWLRTGFVCGTITAYPCEYVRRLS